VYKSQTKPGESTLSYRRKKPDTAVVSSRKKFRMEEICFKIETLWYC